VPGSAFGPTGEAHLRICYARADADIEVAFERLNDYFNGRSVRAPAPATSAAIAPRSRTQGRVRRAGIASLHALARVYLARHRPRVIVIAGSRGKTVLKRLLVEALAPYRRVRANPLSYNTEIGLPLAVLDTTFDTHRIGSVVRGLGRALWTAFAARTRLDVLVLELGARQPGDMAMHLRTVRPNMAVIASLSPSFSEDHRALAVMRREVAQLCADVTRREGVVWLCGDDPSLAALAQELPAARCFTRDQWHEDNGRSAVTVGGQSFPVEREVVGDSNVYGLIVAAQIASELGLGEEALRRFLGS
ncbi:MAG TPA: hypothetical protein VL403_20055, partial [Candidatus Kryptonia bacterium]|nr:hypothetical protein [Candidatus Kryptonia bacterium]